MATDAGKTNAALESREVRAPVASLQGLPPVRGTVACGIRELPEEGKPLVVGMMAH